MTRRYNNTNRSRQAAQTTDDIIAATERLLTEKSLEDVHLKAIAAEAGITVQTVLRHMESRDGCLEAVVKMVSARVEKQRGHSEYETIESAISDLIQHYESEGRLILNLLAQEHRGDSFASHLTNQGREYHRKWVTRCFSNYLTNRDAPTIDALVVASDIYTWKLLRLDLGRSQDATRKIMTNMIKKILEA